MRLALALAVALTIAGCGAGSSTPTAGVPSASAGAPSASDTAAPSDSATGSGEPSEPVVPDSPVAGIVVGVDSAGLGQVRGFTLRTNDGETIAFTLGTLENATDFPPGHLKEHQATASPVLVFFNAVNNQLVVYRIEDAG